MATRTLTVNLIGRTDKLQRSFKNASKGADTMSGKLMRATRVASIGFTALAGVAIGAAAALKPMIDKAASMEESLSKNQVVFGESSKAVEAFASRSLHAFGVTERAALEATGVIGTLGKALKMSEADSAAMATTLVGLAGDMSSFNDATVEETLTAIQAGLRGESEPLRRFGVLLDAATLKAKALEKGIISNTKDALTPQTKALAAYEVILEQTAVQMGDFTRTADSATNQSKLLAGEWDRIQTEIGTALLPAFTSIVKHLRESVLPAVEQFWSDPSWYEGGVLAGKAADSGFFQGLAGLLSGPGPTEIQDMPWFEKWKASAELAFLATAISAVANFNRGVDDQMNPTDGPEPVFQQMMNAAGVVAGGPAERARAAAPAQHPMAQALDAAQSLAGGALSDPGGATTRKSMIEENLAAAAATAAVDAVAGGVSLSQLTGGGGAAAAAVAETDLDRFLKVVGTTDWDNFLAAQAIGGPPNTQIVINAPAVSGQEVVEAIGKYVDGNGPLPPHWQQGAN